MHRKGEAEIPMSKLFTALNELKKARQYGEEPSVSDFTYFEPSLHHAFVALNQENADQIVSK